jgi:hypothetical protein
MDSVVLQDGDLIVYQELPSHFIAFVGYQRGNTYLPLRPLSLASVCRNEQTSQWEEATLPDRDLFRSQCQHLAQRSGLRLTELDCTRNDRGEVCWKILVQK